jgi:ribonuclease Z
MPRTPLDLAQYCTSDATPERIMRPLLHPRLVNGRTGDPALYVETLFDRRAILFDLGDISALSPRNIQRIDHVFVSHAHIDHFVGFDHLLRRMVGREKTIRLWGPLGFIDHVNHKLRAYRWNLVDRYPCDLAFLVTEIDDAFAARTTRFRLKQTFAEEPVGETRIVGGILLDDPMFRVSTAVLEHRTPCLGFAIEEPAHINVWKNRLEEMGLPVGQWLRELKRAVNEGKPDDHPIRIVSRSGPHEVPEMRLAALRDVLTVTPGQKIAYVTDVADTPNNRSAIVDLVRNADLLFIESAFAQADVALAAERAHLTTTAAGHIARDAYVRRVEPFHFSPRYAGKEQRMLDEVMVAFCGRTVAGPAP